MTTTMRSREKPSSTNLLWVSVLTGHIEILVFTCKLLRDLRQPPVTYAQAYHIPLNSVLCQFPTIAFSLEQAGFTTGDHGLRYCLSSDFIRTGLHLSMQPFSFMITFESFIRSRMPLRPIIASILLFHHRKYRLHVSCYILPAISIDYVCSVPLQLSCCSWPCRNG